MKRIGLLSVACFFSLCILRLMGTESGKPLPPVYAAQGVMVGEVTAESALVQLRLTASDKLVERDVPGAAGFVRFVLNRTEAPNGTPGVPQVVEAVADNDFIARASFTGLMPGQEYWCQTYIGPTNNPGNAGPWVSFRTLPGAEQATKLSFVVVTGMNYAKFHGDDRIDLKEHLKQNNTELPPPYKGADKPLGYPALETILKLKPAFFVGTGDNVYYDTPTNPRSKTLAEMRQKWHEQFVQPRYRDLFAKVPTYWEIDDHDFRYDDCDNSGDELPLPATGLKVMLEQLPYAPMGDPQAKTYRTHRVTRDLQIWLTENRVYRSPSSMEDGPKKTIWGAEQKAWLKSTLQASDATFKVLISPTPLIGPDDLRKTDNHCDIGGFRHERDEFFTWLKETKIANNFYLVCGDRHWQYHSVDPSGLEEFSSGALVDANSRLGRKPGDPKSTDAEATIKQPYYQTPASGGFLLVEVTPSTTAKPSSLQFKFHNTRGKLLYEHEKMPR